MLSFGTLFRAQKVSYVYGIEFYGTDVISVKRHIIKHMTELKQRASGQWDFQTESVIERDLIQH